MPLLERLRRRYREPALMTDRQRTAIIYDFDGTLAPGNIQEHQFLKDMGITPAEFWSASNGSAEENDADEILVYMRHMLVKARAMGIPLTKDYLQKCGASTPFFDGVTSWFQRINGFADKLGLDLEHYVISSGIKEMIEGCAIAEHFRIIYASSFLYDDDGIACWPALSINYTGKTQYLFRINKGIENAWDTKAINRFTPRSERPIPFSHMLFIGDGLTDIPSMRMIRYQGGHAVAVFDPSKWDALQEHIVELIAADRANLVAPADYTAGSQLEVTVRGLLGKIATFN